MVSVTIKPMDYDLPHVFINTSNLSSLNYSPASSSSNLISATKVTFSQPNVSNIVSCKQSSVAIESMTSKESQESFEEAPMWAAVITYIGYLILNLFGFLRDFLRCIGLESKKGTNDPNPPEFVPLFSEYECFYTRNMYTRIRDCFNRPICSVPGATITLVGRESDDYNWTFKKSGKNLEALNLGSYNYLGFAENEGKCAQQSIEALRENGVACTAARQELGTHQIHRDLEKKLAEFLRVEDTIVFGMGFATNANNIPSLVGKVCFFLIRPKLRS